MKYGVILFLLFHLSACSQLQDVGTAQLGIVHGEVESGVASLTELAESGYIDAQLALASYYAGLSDIESIKRAEFWFLQASKYSPGGELKRIRWLAKLGVRNSDYASQAERALLERQHTHNDVSVEQLRFYIQSARLDDSAIQSMADEFLKQPKLLASEKLKIIDITASTERHAELIETLCRADNSSYYYCFRNKISLYKKDASDGVDSLVAGISSAYRRQQLSEEQLSSLLKLMLSNKSGGSQPSLAAKLVSSAAPNSAEFFFLLATAEINQKHTYDVVTLQDRLQAYHHQGLPEASLLLGKFYDIGKRTPEDPWLAEKYYLAAEELPEAKHRVGLLYLSGKLGYHDFQQGVSFLVAAARDGYWRSYRSLFRVFSGYPGVKPNPLFAHTFSAIYTLQGKSLSISDQERLAEFPLPLEQLIEQQRLLKEELVAISASGVNRQYVHNFKKGNQS